MEQGAFVNRLRSLPLILRILILGILYWLFSVLGTLSFYEEFGVALYWPGAGVAIIGIYILGVTASPAIFITALIENFLVYRSADISLSILLLVAFSIALANTLAGILGSKCLTTRVMANERSFFRLDSVLRFLLWVTLIPGLITSLTGGLACYLSGISNDFFFKTQSWFLADMIGILILVPLALSWMNDPLIKIVGKKIPELFIITLLLTLSSYYIFTNAFDNYFYNFLIAYFTTPIYVWLALRFDSKTLLSLQVLSLGFVSYIVLNQGNSFLNSLIEKPYLLLQGFVILIGIITLILNAIIVERDSSILSLLQSEQDLKDTLINLPLGLVILNKNAEPEFINKEFEQKTGFKLEDFFKKGREFTGKSTANESLNFLKLAWKEYIKNPGLEAYSPNDISLNTMEGEVRNFSLDVNPLKDRFLAVMMDVTQRKKLLETIRENERRLNSLIQNLQGMVYQSRFDKNWTMEFVSEGSFLLTGYLPSEIRFNKEIAYGMIIQEEFRDFVWKTKEKAIKKGEAYSLQYQISTKSGESKWVSENGNGIFDSEGKCRNLEGIIYDNTEKIESVNSLKKEEEKYRSLFENMPVSLWEDDYSEVKKILDNLPAERKRDIVQTLSSDVKLYNRLISGIQIVNMNKSSLDLYGESDKGKLISSVPEIFGSGDSTAFISVLVSFYEGRSSLEERVMEVKINGKKRYLNVQWFIMPGHLKNLSRILVTILDITELKKAEKEIRLLNQNLEKKVLKRTEQLDSTNKELEAFSYSVSHDLKAPLRAILGFSALLEEEFSDALPKEALHYVAAIQKNSINMNILITDLLQFSKLGRKGLSLDRIDTESMVKSICEEILSQQGTDDLSTEISRLPFVHGDASMLRQVFINIISNSVKFRSKDRKNIIRISCTPNNDYHQFCISDTGIGFDQKHAESIFKVFQRLQPEENFEGSGVGLALVQRIIHKHGGNIWAESSKGKGTAIYFTLPVKIESE